MNPRVSLSRRHVLERLGWLGVGLILPAACQRQNRQRTLTGQAKGTVIGVLQFVQAAPPDAARRALLEELARNGFGAAQGLRVLERVAGGSMVTAHQQASQLVKDGADLLVAIGTPALHACLDVAPATLPVVFCFCSNPWGVGAGRSYSNHRANVTGTVSTNPVGDQLDLARRLQPDLLAVGLIYDPSQPNSSFEAELLRREASERRIEVEAEPVAAPAEVPGAAERLLQQGIQAFVTVGDYATIEAFPQLAARALQARVPVYSVDPSDISVPGCLAVVGWDPASDGRQAGALALKVLKGISPAQLPFEGARDQLLLLNARTAQQLNLTLPPAVLQQADRVVG